MKQKPLILNGKNLAAADLSRLVKEPTIKVVLGGEAKKNLARSAAFLRSALKANHKIIYGVNTGFGPMASYILPHDKLVELQNNLILSHSVGMGKKLEPELVLSAMVVRLNTLLKGHSGVSPELAATLAEMINHRIIPVVYEHGAVGTSGDLVQLAHIALALIGRGEVDYKGKIMPAKTALNKCGIKPYELQPKEGLSLINGTSMMTGIAALLCQEAEHLLNLAVINGCLSLELVGGYSDSFSAKLHDLRPHPGQKNIAAKMRKILESSKLIQNREILDKKSNQGHKVDKIPEHVQEVYSMRCIAQILGPISDTLARAKTETETEMNSVTDNPIVDWQNQQFLHGGNFHGEYIAQAMDQLKISFTKLGMLSERRVNFFLNPNINKNLPPFLNLHQPGLSLALQGLQFVATSTAAHSQTLSYPMSLHSISTNGDNQDVVSMGTDAALLAKMVLENVLIVLTIEAVSLAQAVDYLGVQKELSQTTRKLYRHVRGILPAISTDREITSALNKLSLSLKNL